MDYSIDCSVIIISYWNWIRSRFIRRLLSLGIRCIFIKIVTYIRFCLRAFNIDHPFPKTKWKPDFQKSHVLGKELHMYVLWKMMLKNMKRRSCFSAPSLTSLWSTTYSEKRIKWWRESGICTTNGDQSESTAVTSMDCPYWHRDIMKKIRFLAIESIENRKYKFNQGMLIVSKMRERLEYKLNSFLFWCCFFAKDSGSHN